MRIKITVIILTFIVLLVFLSGCVDNKTNQTNKQLNQTFQNNSTHSSTNSTNKPQITPERAKSIAQQFIKQPGATAGTPELTNINGRQVYLVPVIMNGQNVGAIEIDANTGENLGGGGGAP